MRLAEQLLLNRLLDAAGVYCPACCSQDITVRDEFIAANSQCHCYNCGEDFEAVEAQVLVSDVLSWAQRMMED